MSSLPGSHPELSCASLSLSTSRWQRTLADVGVARPGCRTRPARTQRAGDLVSSRSGGAVGGSWQMAALRAATAAQRSGKQHHCRRDDRGGDEHADEHADHAPRGESCAGACAARHELAGGAGSAAGWPAAGPAGTASPAAPVRPPPAGRMDRWRWIDPAPRRRHPRRASRRTTSRAVRAPPAGWCRPRSRHRSSAPAPGAAGHR